VLGPARASLAWEATCCVSQRSLQSPEAERQRGPCPALAEAARAGGRHLTLAVAAPRVLRCSDSEPLLGFELEGDLAASGSLLGRSQDLRSLMFQLHVLNSRWRAALRSRKPGGGRSRTTFGAGSSLRMASPRARHRQAKAACRLSANWLPQQVGAGANAKGSATGRQPQRYNGWRSSFPFDGTRGGGRAQGAPNTIGGTAEWPACSLDLHRLAFQRLRSRLSVLMRLELLGKGTHGHGGIPRALFQASRVALSRLEGGLVTYPPVGQTNGALRAQLEGPAGCHWRCSANWWELAVDPGRVRLPGGRPRDLARC